MEPKQNFAGVGLFVLGTIICMIALGIWLGGYLNRSNKLCYLMQFNNSVAGLNPGGTIKFRGVDVGHIDTITFNPQDDTQIVIKSLLDRDTPIHTNTVAQIKPQGVTGSSYIELDVTDTSTTQPSVHDDGCRVIPTVPSNVDQILNSLPLLITQTKEIAEKINGVLAPANVAAFNTALQNFSQLSVNLNQQSAVLGPKLDDAATQLEQALRSVNLTAADIQKSSQGDLRQLNQTLREVNATAAEIHDFVEQLRANPLATLIPAKTKEVKIP